MTEADIYSTLRLEDCSTSESIGQAQWRLTCGLKYKLMKPICGFETVPDMSHDEHGIMSVINSRMYFEIVKYSKKQF